MMPSKDTSMPLAGMLNQADDALRTTPSTTQDSINGQTEIDRRVAADIMRRLDKVG